MKLVEEVPSWMWFLMSSVAALMACFTPGPVILKYWAFAWGAMISGLMIGALMMRPKTEERRRE